MIRTLLDAKMSHRMIAKTLKISHGSVSLEKRCLVLEQRKAEEVKIALESKSREAVLQVIDDAAPW